MTGTRGLLIRLSLGVGMTALGAASAWAGSRDFEIVDRISREEGRNVRFVAYEQRASQGSLGVITRLSRLYRVVDGMPDFGGIRVGDLNDIDTTSERQLRAEDRSREEQVAREAGEICAELDRGVFLSLEIEEGQLVAVSCLREGEVLPEPAPQPTEEELREQRRLESLMRNSRPR